MNQLHTLHQPPAKALGNRRSFLRYPHYRHANIEWIDQIPAHWTVWKAAHAFEIIGSGTTPKSENLDYYGGNIPWVTTSELRESTITDAAQKITHAALKDYPSLKLYAPGTVLIAMYGATIGRLGILGAPATVNQACCAFAKSAVVDSKFMYHWLAARRPVLISLSAGGGQPNLSQADLRQLRVPVPPLNEQRAIAAFLDRETARIDALIAKKQRLIGLLEEKGAALISRAVTTGLNHVGSEEAEGTDWTGSVIAQWPIKRLKYVATIQTGLTLGKKYDDGTQLARRPYLRVANVQDGYLDLAEITEVELPESDIERYELQEGDVLMTEGGDFDKLGRGYVWHSQIEGCLHQNHVFAVRPRKESLLPEYLAALMTSTYGKAYFASTANQTTNLASTNSTKLKGFPLPLPTAKEQRAILNWVRLQADPIDRAASGIQRGIDSLREYRAALISAAVTGKIDVREEAA
ncbi:MAG: restriction endonuclease subunit S [Bryobacterales bacterium]